ncbi:hypothetical protein ACOSP7_027505 [Xanthoceras sorbifolium]|uniref:DUF7733 domain-containing protein n=1 Tax=Xanthoceras sorbifolium TaxID=99658 RepID=A0ABQ8HGC9_9ROSI|nr:hypothetical protein JRO89_XS11G0198000 [Xanthoceras sorbifolium]
MSGGVGPTGSDISLPKEEEAAFKLHDDTAAPGSSLKSKTATETTPSTPRRHMFLNFHQLNALAVIIVLSASGMVSPEDFGFVIFSLVYIFFLSRVAFPTLHPSHVSPVFDVKSKLFRLYVYVGAAVGLFLPIAYIFEGIFEGDQEGIKEATPHVFLLASQIFMEGVSFSDRFSIPIRVLVPVMYNARRILTLLDWLRNEISKNEEDYKGTARRLYVGRALAVANMAFWSFNLFGLLLPVYLPRGFKKYYTAKIKD